MDYGRRLIGNLTVLNALLAAAVFFAVRYAVYPFFGMAVAVSPAAAAKSLLPTKEQVAVASRSPIDFSVIAERNLFHPERRIPPEKTEKDRVKELPKPDLVLYGTMITDEISMAYVEDNKAPYATPGRGKRQIVMKKGDTVSGFVLKEIEPTRIVLLRGTEQLVVSLDVKDRRRGGEVAAEATVSRGRTNGPSPPPSIMPAVPGQAATMAQPGSAGSSTATAPPGVAAPGRQTPAASWQKQPAHYDDALRRRRRL